MIRSSSLLILLVACGGASTPSDTQTSAHHPPQNQSDSPQVETASEPEVPVDVPNGTVTQPETNSAPLLTALKENGKLEEALAASDTDKELSGAVSTTRSAELFRECRGRLNRRRAEAVIKKVNEKLAECFLVEHETAPGLKGDVRLTVKVSKSGKVDDVHNISPFNDTTKSCMNTHVKKLKFRKPSGGCATLTKSFHFEIAE